MKKPKRTRRGRPNPKRNYRTAKQIEEANRRAFHEAAWKQRVCQMCGKGGQYESHHVTEKQKLRIEFRMDVVWDTRNCMRLCTGCHTGQTLRYRKVTLDKLSDDNYEFCFEILGVAAHNYLARTYDGKDPRLDEWLRKTEGEDEQPADATAGI